MLLATLNSGTLVIALPELERALGVDLLTLVWVILAFMIASTVLVLFFGRLSDVFGRKRAFVGGFAVFTVASLGAGFATGGTDLLLWRVLQGVGGAMLFANATALVTDAFPREELGIAMGTNVMIAGVGLVLGPVLGGALVEISWHWVFWFNVPIGLFGTYWAATVLQELVPPEQERRFDWLGTLLFVVGLTGLTYGMSRGGIVSWTDAHTVVSLLAAAVLLPAFILVERRVAEPMLDLSLFEDRGFNAATGAAFLSGLSRFSLTFVFVLYFQGALGDDPILAGVKLAPLAAGMLISSPIAGRYADRHGARSLSAIGLIVSAAGMAGMATLQVGTPYWLTATWLLIAGIGSGMFNSPNTAAMMGAVPAHRRGIAGGTRMMLQNTGSVLSIALLLAIVTNGIPTETLLSIFSGVTTGLSADALDPFIHNLHIAMWVLTATSLAGAAVALMRRKTAPGGTGAGTAPAVPTPSARVPA
ncbi:Riboflavin transporter RibZ [Paraconexibacter sp. AEG42_29]|uniref:Riboflavin transporter RibZ n=1 Tax=Paraconexibacter sp. AEG42_29 TaxID=2997339 RepID=A0AAU7B2X4_9ACTN